MEGPGPPARRPLSFPRCRAERERERGDFVSAAEGVHQLCLEFSNPAPLSTCPIQTHRLVLGKPGGAGGQVCWPLSTSSPQRLCPGGSGRSLSFPRSSLAWVPGSPSFCPSCGACSQQIPAGHFSTRGHRLGPPQPLSSPRTGLLRDSLPNSFHDPALLCQGGCGRRG